MMTRKQLLDSMRTPDSPNQEQPMKTLKTVSVDNPIAKTVHVVVFDEACVARVEAAIEAATACAVIDSPEVHSYASAAYRALKNSEKEIEDTRTRVKGPVLSLGRIIDDASRAFAAPLSAERERLGKELAKYEAEIARQREEAERLERARLAALARIEAERLAAERLAERQAAEALAAAEAAATAAAEDMWGSLGDEEPVVVAPVVVAPIVIPAELLAPSAPPPPSLAPSAIKMISKYAVEIVDASLIPREFLLVDEAAILAALKAGLTVDGAVLHTTKVPAAR